MNHSDLKYGECAKHPGNNMVNCVWCGMEKNESQIGEVFNGVETLRPCDCKDSIDTSSLEEQGIGHNDESIVVIPNYVLLTMGHTTVKIGMKRFKMFAEWYLEPQKISK